MNPNIAIIIDYTGFSEENNLGGSETWAVEISKQFVRNNYNVFLFTRNPIWHWSLSGVQYIPINKLSNFLTYIKFDYIFISRYIFSSTLNLLNDYPLHNNLYWIAHDTDILIDYENITIDKFNSNNILKNHLNKIICMSDFCKECIQSILNLDDSYFEIIGNGLTLSLFNTNKKTYKDNNLFWSSRWERGLELIVNHILPILHRDYPNMKIYVAQYDNEIPDELKNNKSIIFLGKLNKEELYDEMQKHKVMFYPNFYPETFCITIIEAAMNDMEIICPLTHGPATIFKQYSSMFPKYDITYNSDEEYNKVAIDIKERLEEYYNKDRIIIRNLIKEHIINNYSWESIFKQYKERILK